MSGRARKRVGIACVLLLVCGVVAAVIMRRPSGGLTLKLIGLETNSGEVSANILVSNNRQHALNYIFVSDHKSPEGWRDLSGLEGLLPANSGFRLVPGSSTTNNLKLRAGPPWRIIVLTGKMHSSDLIERVRLHIRKQPQGIYTLEISE